MLKNFFIVFFTFVKSLAAATFLLKGNKALYLSGGNLFKRSFRVSHKETRDPFVILKRSGSTLKQLLTVKRKEISVTSSPEFIYDISSNSKKIRQDYIRHFTGGFLENYVPKLELLGELDTVGRFVIVLVFFLFFPFFFLFTLFSRHKPSLALLFTEIVENTVLLYKVDKHQLRTCYFFSIYEKDSNIAACLLMKKGVKVVKIPSEVPFYFFNTTIICNKLIICTAYQLDELEHYKETLIYDSHEFWGPERVCDFYEVYKNRNYTVRRNAIAFYSTASWVREKEGHIDQGTNMKKNEQLLLGYLREYLQRQKDKTLIIYPHPKEKSEKYISETKAYYKSLLPDVNFEFADFNMLSAGSFYNAELAVAFNSTLVHERLYFGFKILILPLDHPGFPIENSSFNSICSSSKEELFKKMDASFTQTEEEFFQRNGLQHYRFKS